jgi:hypothetical protein
MKKVNLFFIGLILFVSLSFTSCNPNVPEIVCDYGTVLCDVSTTICRDIPGVPPVVCNYLDLACYNLNTLCVMRDQPESFAYQNALQNIQDITSKLRTWKVAQDSTK